MATCGAASALWSSALQPNRCSKYRTLNLTQSPKYNSSNKGLNLTKKLGQISLKEMDAIIDTKISSKFDELYIKLYSVLYDNLLKNIIFIVDQQKNGSKLSNPPSRNNKRNSENPPLVKLKQEKAKVAKTDIKGKKKLKQILTTPQVHIKPPNYSKIKKNPIDYISRNVTLNLSDDIPKTKPESQIGSFEKSENNIEPFFESCTKAFKSITFREFANSTPKHMCACDEISINSKGNSKKKCCGILCKFLSPQEQKKIITQNCNTAASKHSRYRKICSAKGSNNKYAIDANWWRQWCDYVNIEFQNQSKLVKLLYSETSTVVNDGIHAPKGDIDFTAIPENKEINISSSAESKAKSGCNSVSDSAEENYK